MQRCRLFYHNQEIYHEEYIQVKKHRSSPIILQKSVLRCYKEEFAFFLSGFSLTNIYDLQNSRRRTGYLLMTYLICLVSAMIYIFNCKSLFTGRLKILLFFAILTIAPLISESVLGNTRVTMAIL